MCLQPLFGHYNALHHLHICVWACCKLSSYINKVTDTIKSMANAREINDQVHLNLLEHMAWCLQGFHWTLQYLGRYFCCLGNLVSLAISPTISLHTMIIVLPAKITHYIIWIKAS